MTDIVIREYMMADVDDVFHMHVDWVSELMRQMGVLR